jgi:hypothetical protein
MKNGINTGQIRIKIGRKNSTPVSCRNRRNKVENGTGFFPSIFNTSDVHAPRHSTVHFFRQQQQGPLNMRGRQGSEIPLRRRRADGDYGRRSAKPRPGALV